MVRRSDLAAALSGAALVAACTTPAPAPRTPAASAALLDLQGRPRSLSLEPGEGPLVLHFWTTWCPSCREELDALARARSGCDGAVRVIAVDVAEAADIVERFVSDAGVSLEILRDPDGALWRAGRFAALPANWIVTSAGAQTSTGPRSEAQWRALLGELGCPGAIERR